MHMIKYMFGGALTKRRQQLSSRFIPNRELKMIQEGYSQSFKINKRITGQLNVPLGRHPCQSPLEEPKPNTIIHERVR